MTSEQTVYYWCVPCQDDTKRFQAVIDHLADEQGAPCFMPHLSLASIAGVQPDLSLILQTLHGLELAPREINTTDVFTMSLFVRVEQHPALMRVRQMLAGAPGFRSSRAFDPHLSLCYGPAPAGARGLDMVAGLLRQPVRFDRLVTVDIPSPVRTMTISGPGRYSTR